MKPVKLTDAQIAKIKTLPVGEQEAVKQAVCPVSGDHLGTMGTPFKISTEGRTFYLLATVVRTKSTPIPKA